MASTLDIPPSHCFAHFAIPNQDSTGIVLCGSAVAGEYLRSQGSRFHDPEEATPIAARHVEICIILQKIATIVVACPREA